MLDLGRRVGLRGGGKRLEVAVGFGVWCKEVVDGCKERLDGG